jgi:serine/threonine protein kinase
MMTNGKPADPSAAPAASLDDLLDRLASRIQDGEALDVEALAGAHPEHADELRRLLPAMQALANVEGSKPAAGAGERFAGPLPSGTLGDFRLLREVGRGGMGIVYEAEQLSLGRRVALKVLPFAATMDPRHLQRFHNEARAAAGLHHPHIVPVYAVGQERGVHYYAMQFIDGPTLAQLSGRPDQKAAADTGDLTHAPSGTDAPGRCREPSGTATPDSAARLAAPTSRGAADHRRAAQWAVEAAEALEHAHGLGVVHRDVKPSNLMLDGSGQVWVADFGLARVGTDGGLTGTGDVIGTLRYMSPEQATARHGLVDHRTDVYGLGATLYELLTGRPAYDGDNPADLLPRVVADEPPPPRSVRRSVPAELETVVLKAMAKDPADRYQSAQELANDLRRWLEDRPIRARRPTLAQRAAKWCKRHLTAVWAAGVVLLLAIAGLTTGALLLAAAYQREAHLRHDADDARTRADEARGAEAKQRHDAEEAREAEAKERKRADDGWAEATKQLAIARANLHDAFALASDEEIYQGKPRAEFQEKTLRKMVTVLEKAVAEEPQIIDHRR